MGLVQSTIKFEPQAPKPEEIARKASELCGLDIHFASNLDTATELREFSGHFTFDLLPEEKIEVYSYRMGAIQKHAEEELMGFPSNTQLQGYDDRDGVQRVYLQSYVGCEPTLFDVLTLSLLKLGGQMDRDRDTEYLKEYDRKITLEELQERIRANTQLHKKQRPLYILYGLLFIITLPLQLLRTVIRLPFIIFRMRRQHRELLSKYDL